MRGLVLHSATVDRVEQQLEGAVGLAAMLHAEAEQDDPPLLDLGLDDGRLSGDHLGAHQPAALQEIVRRIARHRGHRVRRLGLDAGLTVAATRRAPQRERRTA